MKSIKSQLLIILTCATMELHEKYNEIMKLLRTTKAVNHVQMRLYNQMGATKESMSTIIYDLQKLYGITDVELRTPIVAQNNTDVSKNETSVPKIEISKELEAAVLQLDVENANYAKELKPLANELATAFDDELKSQKGDDLKAYLLEKQKALQETAFENPFINAPDDAKSGLKLREQFPFLADKDCPDKLKVLVADKLTAYNAVISAREELFKQKDNQTLPQEDILALVSDAVADFQLNQDIFDELNHYKEHGEILGNHPIFEDEMLQKEVSLLSDNDAHKAHKNLATYISKEKKKLEKAKTPESKQKIQDVINGHEAKRKLIAEKLGLDEK
jgi:hypothetical protein